MYTLIAYYKKRIELGTAIPNPNKIIYITKNIIFFILFKMSFFGAISFYCNIAAGDSMKKFRKIISTRITTTTNKKVEDYCKVHDISKSDFLRDLIASVIMEMD